MTACANCNRACCAPVSCGTIPFALLFPAGNLGIIHHGLRGDLAPWYEEGYGHR